MAKVQCPYCKAKAHIELKKVGITRVLCAPRVSWDPGEYCGRAFFLEIVKKFEAKTFKIEGETNEHSN